MSAFQLHFLGIGAQKCATTWLAFRLNDHPEIFIPKEKEIHYWDEHFDKGLDAYQNFFNPIENGARLQGEFTPSYAFLPEERIRAIHDFAPAIRLIYSIRNPIERAWSAALMGVRDCGMQFEEASDAWFLDHFHSQGSIQRGDYAQCLSNWLEVFPPSQLLVLNFEALTRNPREALKACCRHVGADPSKMDGIPEDVVRAKVFNGQCPPIRPRLKEALQELYEERARQTESLLASLPNGIYWNGGERRVLARR